MYIYLNVWPLWHAVKDRPSVVWTGRTAQDTENVTIDKWAYRSTHSQEWNNI